MKRLVPLFMVVVLAGGIAFGATRWVRRSCCPNENTWLRENFSLTSTQIAAIEKIRTDYKQTCSEHCSAVTAAKNRLLSLEHDHLQSTAEYEAARKEWQTLANTYAEAARQHALAIAAQMSPEQGQRYLKLVEPKLTPIAVPAQSAAR